VPQHRFQPRQKVTRQAPAKGACVPPCQVRCRAERNQKRAAWQADTVPQEGQHAERKKSMDSARQNVRRAWEKKGPRQKRAKNVRTRMPLTQKSA